MPDLKTIKNDPELLDQPWDKAKRAKTPWERLRDGLRDAATQAKRGYFVPIAPSHRKDDAHAMTERNAKANLERPANNRLTANTKKCRREIKRLEVSAQAGRLTRKQISI